MVFTRQELVPRHKYYVYLSVVLGSPTLHERHPYGAHFGEFIDRLEPMVHGLCQKGRKFLKLQRNLAKCLVCFLLVGLSNPSYFCTKKYQLKLMLILQYDLLSGNLVNSFLPFFSKHSHPTWLLKIFRLQPGGILQTVVGWKP